jgi:hypothetical protein
MTGKRKGQLYLLKIVFPALFRPKYHFQDVPEYRSTIISEGLLQ